MQVKMRAYCHVRVGKTETIPSSQGLRSGTLLGGNCLVQSKTLLTRQNKGNRDLERDFLSHSLFSRLIAPTLRSSCRNGIKLQHDEPTFPKQIDKLNSYTWREQSY